MNGLPLVTALLLAQAPAAIETPSERAAPEPASAPAPTPAPETRSPEPDPAPARPVKRGAAEEGSPSPSPAVVTTTTRRRVAPGTGASTTTARPAPDRSSTPTPTSTRTPVAVPAPPSPSPPGPVSGREEAERAARAFLDALVRGDASALALGASDRFSFDGEVLSGREVIRRTWRDLLIGRPAGPQPAVGALELLEAEDAATRFGRPPARLAPLVRRGVTIAIADVGGRTVVLFVAREGSRMAVLGMHD